MNAYDVLKINKKKFKLKTKLHNNCETKIIIFDVENQSIVTDHMVLH